MKHSKHIPHLSIFGDLVILNIVFVFSFLYAKDFGPICYQPISILFFLFINVAWYFSASFFKLNKINRQEEEKIVFYKTIKSIVFFFFLFMVFFQVFSFDFHPTDDIKKLFIIFSISLVSWKFLLHYFFIFYRKAGYNYRNVVIVGYNTTAFDLRDYFNSNPWAGYRFKAFFTQNETHTKEEAKAFDELETYVLENQIDEIYMVGNVDKFAHKTLLSIISKHSVSIQYVPELSGFSYTNAKLINYNGIPVMQLQQGPLNIWYNRIAKRLIDISISLLVIVFVLSWMIPLLKIIDLLSGNLGLFFIQERSGLNNRSFNCIKFRSMKTNGEAHTQQAVENDHRITRMGSILRKTSLDELPQFFNVLLGDMTVIGPRPHMLKHTNEYKAYVNKFMVRHSVKPGITGYAQVNGHRGEVKKMRDIKSRIKFDIEYIENWSVLFDMQIILNTLLLFIRGDKKAY